MAKTQKIAFVIVLERFRRGHRKSRRVGLDRLPRHRLELKIGEHQDEAQTDILQVLHFVREEPQNGRGARGAGAAENRADQ